MHLVTYGINHTTAPVAVREKLSFDADKLPLALASLMLNDSVIEAVIVSTCNRTEIYCHLDEDYDNSVLLWLHNFQQQDATALQSYLYHYEGADAVRHLFRVASGLDSLVLGEPQILGQLKTAYTQALNAKALGKSLGRLFQHAFAVAKQVRTDTAIGNSPVSVAFAAVSLAKQIFSNLAESTALLIGAGETIELVARHLFDNGIKRLIIANRTVERAHMLATSVNGYAISLSEIPAHLAEADIVISSTASQLPILGKGTVESALKQRKRRPIFMVDIAVPRDIEAEVGQLEDIYLYTVDDLHDIIEENLQSRRDAAKQAEEIIDTQADHFAGWMRSQDAVPVIRAIRDQGQMLSTQAVDKALRQLEQGMSAEIVMTELARTLTNKLLHEPSRQLRQSAFESDENNPMIDAARRLFNIKD
ncbi:MULTISPECIES: glutamyl-tRNA reductase [unclassified Methylophaga]|jgi:glutamyl-tRNA reductase|uniref:glutamyl-tRNA reductase n=2 Tax=Methylophaga TaxID=40222 RepID=UPI000C98FFD7|nr:MULTISPECIES: glutamyl-tRNA reductase [unclassified Methylophaga]MAK66201.1 glutamyl-tRNA reductase [Methylophaga sp.]MAY17396.1 glutamyl-tRNA reductase [Methylophaga sp.]MBN47338.1 glutamyl-tRNA reductase [Methylophaga sp.]HAO24346.1 glutamyl-tRNA reductase [Methylophaga sp.]|tara:strand:+ start:116876 stop:118135 length:1260 start_codon:yes stop_codon:yes gene_type:complete